MTLPTATCSLCMNHEEDGPHVLKCPAEAAKAQREKGLIKISTWMNLKRTRLELIDILINAVTQWMNALEVQLPMNVDPDIFKHFRNNKTLDGATCLWEWEQKMG